MIVSVIQYDKSNREPWCIQPLHYYNIPSALQNIFQQLLVVVEQLIRVLKL